MSTGVWKPVVEAGASHRHLDRLRHDAAGCKDMWWLHVQWSHLRRYTSQLLCHWMLVLVFIFKPAAAGRRRRRLYVFGSSVRATVHPSMRACVRPSVRDSRGSFMFPRYLQYLLTDFLQTFVTGASRDTDDLITFFGQKVKVQGHTIAAEAHSTRRYRWVQLFLVFFTIIHCGS